MSVALSTALVALVIVTAAIAGPRVIAYAAPALSQKPLAAAVTLTGTALLWAGTLAAIGPLVAWMSSGPAWLPDQAAAVCTQCLSAATPFGESPLLLGLPPLIPLMLPAVGVLLALAGLVREGFTLHASRATLLRDLGHVSHVTTVLGHRVLLVEDPLPNAFSLPNRYGGIVVTQGALTALSHGELSAVLEHEAAHLRQRHHLCLAVLNGTTRYLRWVPLIASIRAAVPHYLEIAADQAATKRTGIPALASALLKLGAHTVVAPAGAAHVGPAPASVLHAAGPQRIRSLIGLPKTRLSVTLVTIAVVYAATLVSVVTAIHAPYAIAVLTGC